MTKKPRVPRKKPSPKRTRAAATPREPAERALTRSPPAREVRPIDRPTTSEERVKPPIDPLTGDLPGITLKDARAVLLHFERVDPRLAEAWRRDVVVHEGPITLRRIMYPASFGGATHYAYVDRRLLWYLKHDPSDPIGARWDGYLAHRGDAPPGTVAVAVGLDIVAKKVAPRLGEGSR